MPRVSNADILRCQRPSALAISHSVCQLWRRLAAEAVGLGTVSALLAQARQGHHLQQEKLPGCCHIPAALLPATGLALCSPQYLQSGRHQTCTGASQQVICQHRCDTMVIDV